MSTKLHKRKHSERAEIQNEDKVATESRFSEVEMQVTQTFTSVPMKNSKQYKST